MAGAEATSDARAVADATSDALDGLVAADGGRVLYRAIAVATGENHACALLDDHRVKCWGWNHVGQLGYGDTRARGLSPSEMGDALPTVDLGSGRTATAIAASRYTSCAILDDGSIKCWGAPQLNGEVSGSNIGDLPGEMGDELPPLDFGGRRAVNVGMGWASACASMDDDTIWCWGTTLPSAKSGPDGPGTPWQVVGLPAKRVRAFGTSENGVIALYDDGTIGHLPGGVDLPPFDHKVVAVAGSAAFPGTCVLFDDATTACGVGADGTVALNGPANAIAIGVQHEAALCSALSDGSIHCLEGCSTASCEASFDLGAAAVAVTSNGEEFSCALLASGTIKCWLSFVDATMPPDPRLGAPIDSTQTSSNVKNAVGLAVDLGAPP